MTITEQQDAPPQGPLNAESVSLLKAGDVLRHPDGRTGMFVGLQADGGIHVQASKHGFWTFWMHDQIAFIGRPDQDGWIEWSGGENPVPGCVVEVKLRSGDCFTGSDLTDDGTWRHIWGEADIIAFRLAAPSASEQVGMSEANAPSNVAGARERLDPWADLRAAALKATKGPWQRSGVRKKLGDEDCIGVGPDAFLIAFLPTGRRPEEHAGAFKDAGYIAAANPEAILALLSHSDRQGEENERLRGALESIANDDKPELGNRNTNDLLARMYWEIAHKATRARQGGPDHG